MSPGDELRLSSLVEEAHKLAERSRQGMQSLESVNNLGVAISAAAIGVSVSADQALVIVVAPVVGLLLLVHAIQTFTEVSMMAGHRRFLEEYLSEQFGKPFLCHESVIGVERNKSVDLRLQQGLYGSVVLAVATAAWIVVQQDGPLWLLIAYTIFVVAACVVLVVSVKAMMASSDRAQALASEYFNGGKTVAVERPD